MARLAATSGSVPTRLDIVLSTVITGCADFCAGARQGRNIEERYHALECRSAPDLAKLGLTRADIARAALTSSLH